MKQKLRLSGRYPWHVMLAAIAAVVLFVPQMLYWNHVTGQLFFYSYQNAGEGLDFLSPYTWQFLFSFRKGWFIYTPLILFSFAGFYFLFRKQKAVAVAALVFVVATIYISSSWTCWWYAGGSFSARTMVPVYTVLAIPMGYTLQAINKVRLKRFWYALASFFVLLNLFQTWQFEHSIISKERMTRDYYFEIFGATEIPENKDELLLIDRTIKDFDRFAEKYNVEGEVIFEDGYDRPGQEEKGFQQFRGVPVVKLGKGKRFSPSFTKPYQELTANKWAWLIVEANVFIPKDYSGKPPLIVGLMSHKGQAYKYRTASSPEGKLVKGAWNTLRLEYLTPTIRNNKDEFMTYIWQRNDIHVAADKLTVTLFTATNR